MGKNKINRNGKRNTKKEMVMDWPHITKAENFPSLGRHSCGTYRKNNQRKAQDHLVKDCCGRDGEYQWHQLERMAHDSGR